MVKNGQNSVYIVIEWPQNGVTVGEKNKHTAKIGSNHTGKFLFICFCNFEHVPTRILKQMIYHWKALI